MKKICTTLFAAGIIALFYSGDVNARQCCGGGMSGPVNYDRATVETVKGTIVDIGTFRRGGMHISLKTAKETIDVHIGPDFYVKEKIKLANGDEIVVAGSRVKYEGKDAIIARSVEKGGVKVQLRKEDGTPLWARQGHRQNR